MARIRTIKPDFWTDEKLVELEPWERLLFIGIWNFVDDEGFMPFSPKRIKMQIFPADSLEVSRGLQNLISIGALSLYDSEDGQVIQVTNWLKHQKISNPSKSKYADLKLAPAGQEPRNPAESTAETLDFPASPSEGSRGLNTEVEREREVEVKKPSSKPSASTEFDAFWKDYPRKVGKEAAKKAFARALKLTDAQRIMSGLETLRIQVAGKDQQYIPHPSTWLNEGRWDDEVMQQPRLAVVPQQYGWANQ